MLENNKLYFENLNAVRFFAAFMVFLSHAFRPTYDLIGVGNPVIDRLAFLLMDGGTGVSVFFVLSGFLITYLLIHEYKKNQKVELVRFYIRRVLRIWPLYILVLLFAFIVYPLLRPMTGAMEPAASNVWYHIFFLSNFDLMFLEQSVNPNIALPQSINWSVSIEEQFYIFWPLIFVFFKPGYWLYLISGILISSLIWRLCHYDDVFLLYYHSFSVILDLAMGGLFAYLIHFKPEIRKRFENTGTIHHLILFGFAFGLLYWHDFFIRNEYKTAVWRVLTTLSFALMISAQALTKKKSIMNLGRIRFADYWGKYTYGMYMLHPIAILIVSLIYSVFNLPDNTLTYSLAGDLLAFLLTLLLSKLSYDYLESFFLKKKERFRSV